MFGVEVFPEQVRALAAGGKSEGTWGGGHVVYQSVTLAASLILYYKVILMQFVDTRVCVMVGGCVSKAKVSRVWLAFKGGVDAVE